MLIPSKYEDINYNLIVIGAKVIKLLKVSPYNIEDLFHKMQKNYKLNLEQFFNTLTYLWLAEIIVLDLYQISLNRKNDSK